MRQLVVMIAGGMLTAEALLTASGAPLGVSSVAGAILFVGCLVVLGALRRWSPARLT